MQAGSAAGRCSRWTRRCQGHGSRRAGSAVRHSSGSASGRGCGRVAQVRRPRDPRRDAAQAALLGRPVNLSSPTLTSSLSTSRPSSTATNVCSPSPGHVGEVTASGVPLALRARGAGCARIARASAPDRPPGCGGLPVMPGAAVIAACPARRFGVPRCCRRPAWVPALVRQAGRGLQVAVQLAGQRALHREVGDDADGGAGDRRAARQPGDQPAAQRAGDAERAIVRLTAIGLELSLRATRPASARNRRRGPCG